MSEQLVNIFSWFAVKPSAVSCLYICDTSHSIGAEIVTTYTLKIVVNKKVISLYSDESKEALISMLNKIAEELNKHHTNSEKNIQDMVKAVYYAPGMPGYLQAKESFEGNTEKK